jgi:DNA-binding MarR family transcriptional regulator
MSIAISSRSSDARPALDAWGRLRRAHASTSRALSARLLEEHSLTVNDYEALLHLSCAESGLMRRVDLADRLLMTASGVTRLLDGLEAAGLVEKARCPSDRRVSYAVLTHAGRRRLEAASRSHAAAVGAVFEARFSDAELHRLSELLGRVPGDEAGDRPAVSSPARRGPPSG